MGAAAHGIGDSRGVAAGWPQAAPARMPGYLPSLTGLRFWAAALVVVYHLTIHVGAVPVVSDLAKFGRTGVSFFFVLSGFVLAWTYRGASTPKRVFWWRRFARIWPLHIFATILVALIYIWTSNPIADHLTFGELWPAFFLIHAWFPSSPVIQGGNGATWSLSNEAYFYFLFPFVLPLLAGARRVGWLLAVPVVVTGVYLLLWAAIPVDGIGEYRRAVLLDYFPATRFLQFLAGIALALALQRGWRCPVRVPVAALVVVLYHAALVPWANVTTRSTPFGPQSASQLFSVIPFALLIAAVATSDLAGKRLHLGRPSFVLLGHASFAWYLLHPAGILVYLKLFGRPDSLAATMLAFAAVLIVTQAAAILAYRCVEHPIERRLRPLVSAGRTVPAMVPSGSVAR